MFSHLQGANMEASDTAVAFARAKSRLLQKGGGGLNVEKRMTSDTADQLVFQPVSRCVRFRERTVPIHLINRKRTC